MPFSIGQNFGPMNLDLYYYNDFRDFVCKVFCYLLHLLFLLIITEGNYFDFSLDFIIILV